MTKITYTKNFIDTLKLAESRGLFLGTGNPNSTILIIGNEVAIDIEKNPQHHKLEVLDNVSDWEKNIKQNKQFGGIDQMVLKF